MSHHPPSVRHAVLYLGSLTAPPGALLLLGAVADACLHGRGFAPGLTRLAGVYHRSPRTLVRWTRVLEAHGWLSVVRRRRCLTNLYRLSRALWERLTGHRRRPWPRPVQESLERLGLAMGLKPARLGAAFDGPPGRTDGAAALRATGRVG